MENEQIDSIELKSNETTDKYINKKRSKEAWFESPNGKKERVSLWIELNGYSSFCCHIANQLCLFLLLLLLLWYANLFRWSNTVLHSASAIRDSISENSLVWSIDDKHQCFVFLVYSFSLLLLLLRDLPMLPMALTLTANENKKRSRKKNENFPSLFQYN